ncbi:hypothetical protein D3C76_386120 [compost metagenome]
MLQLRRGWQQDVGVIGGVGLEMFQHHGEQVLAGKALSDFRRLGRHRHRIRVVHDQRFDLRAELGRGLTQQVIADGAHVDGARLAARAQLRTLQCTEIDREGVRRRQQGTAGGLSPGANQGRQTGDVAHRHAAATHALQAVVEADRHGLAALACLTVVPRQLEHFLGGDAADLRGALRRPLLHALLELFEAQGVLGDVRLVQQILGDQHMHHAERQRRVGARHQRNMLVAFFRRERAVGIDGDELGAAPLGLLHAGPEVQVGGDRVAAPDQNQFGMLELFDIGAQLGADGVRVADTARGAADGAIEVRRADLVEKARGHRVTLHQAHGAGIAVRQDGLRGARRDVLEACGNGIEGLVPAYALKRAFTFSADPLHRVQQAIRVIGTLEIARHLGTERSPGGRMLRVATHFGGDPVLHGHQHRAGVGAIMRASRANDGRSHWSTSEEKLGREGEGSDRSRASQAGCRSSGLSRMASTASSDSSPRPSSSRTTNASRACSWRVM